MITQNGETKIKDEIIRQGIIRIQPQLILEWLKFEGGHIRNVRMDFGSNIEMLIEHPDMPDTVIGSQALCIMPTYRIDYPSKEIIRLTPNRKEI